MGILDDLYRAVEDYPQEYLTLEIFDVDPAVGDSINENEDIEFMIRVSNRGPLHVRDLTLKIEGLRGTQVKQNGALAQYGSAFTTAVGQFDIVPAHTGGTPVENNGGGFRFKASSQSTLSRDLVRVSVAGWETHFDHVTSSHSQEDADAQVVFASSVAAQ